MSENASDDAVRQQVVATLTDLWQALDDRDTPTVQTLVTADFIAIDAFPPHVWTGPGALDRWLADLWTYCDGLGVTLCQTTLRDPSRVTLNGDLAYIVAPAMMASARGSDLIAQSGFASAALHREAGAWRVAGLCWAGQ